MAIARSSVEDETVEGETLANMLKREFNIDIPMLNIVSMDSLRKVG